MDPASLLAIVRMEACEEGAGTAGAQAVRHPAAVQRPPRWVRQEREVRVNDRVCVIRSIRPALASKSIQLYNLTHYTV